MSEGADQAREPANGAAYFGEETRALREALGLPQSEFADKLHYRQAQVSKVENGTVLASAAFAEAMDRVAGTPGVYARLRAKLSKQGHPGWFVPYINLERKATRVEDYSNALIMGMLQTAEYAWPTSSVSWLQKRQTPMSHFKFFGSRGVPPRHRCRLSCSRQTTGRQPCTRRPEGWGT